MTRGSRTKTEMGSGVRKKMIIKKTTMMKRIIATKIDIFPKATLKGQWW